ncbi:hypothetical protein NEDG_00799 [Nematocida displodere]|uniref:Uncharacterized protein n=1 Tax=Nematocida displodere TaxID=1805483 RepID=A0A177ED62_9MICR|nr:hypothetical protein NEDG_00799 [Nematocida displodere]
MGIKDTLNLLEREVLGNTAYYLDAKYYTIAARNQHLSRDQVSLKRAALLQARQEIDTVSQEVKEIEAEIEVLKNKTRRNVQHYTINLADLLSKVISAPRNHPHRKATLSPATYAVSFTGTRLTLPHTNARAYADLLSGLYL